MAQGIHSGRLGIRSYFADGDVSNGDDFEAEGLAERRIAAGLLALLGGEGQFSGTALSTGTTVAAGEWLLLDDSGYPHYRKTTTTTAITFGATSGNQDLYAILALVAGVSPELADESALNKIEFETVPAGNPAPANHALKLGTGAVTASSFTSFTYDAGIRWYGALPDLLPHVTFSVGAEATNVIPVTCQFRDALQNALAQQMAARLWLGDAAHAAVSADPPSGGWAAGVGTLTESITTSVHGFFESDTNGVIRVDITEAAADTWYLMAEVGGRVYASGAITFA